MGLNGCVYIRALWFLLFFFLLCALDSSEEIGNARPTMTERQRGAKRNSTNTENEKEIEKQSTELARFYFADIEFYFCLSARQLYNVCLCVCVCVREAESASE